MAVSTTTPVLPVRRQRFAQPPPPEASRDAWKYWQSKFTRSKGDLLADDLDPVEERHMDLKLDDAESFLAKLRSPKFILVPPPLPCKRARISYYPCKRTDRSPVAITSHAQPGQRFCFL
jgi:hypothetical protein